MSSKIKHELCVAVERYTDREGKEKSRWQKVGVELETESGGRIILLERWFNPAGVMNPDGRTTVMLSMFEPKGYGAGSGATTQTPGAGLTPDDFKPEGAPPAAADGEIPF